MKRMLCVALVSVIVMMGAGSALAQPPMGAPDEMKMIANMDGKYDVQFKYRFDPSQDWQETAATCEISSMLDGACQKMEFAGEMMGMPMKGIGWTAFNRGTGKWQTTWVDNLGASISYYEGVMTDGEMVFEGSDTAPDGTTFKSRNTTYNMTDDGFEWKMEVSMDGENYMTSAMATYTRKGKAKAAKEKKDEGGW